jgi:hypothetical protein
LRRNPLRRNTKVIRDTEAGALLQKRPLLFVVA